MQSVIGSIATHPEEASRPAQEGSHVDQHHSHHHRPLSPVRRWRVLLVTPQVTRALSQAGSAKLIG
jgi:hypothetical protein